MKHKESLSNPIIKHYLLAHYYKGTIKNESFIWDVNKIAENYFLSSDEIRINRDMLLIAGEFEWSKDLNNLYAFITHEGSKAYLEDKYLNQNKEDEKFNLEFEELKKKVDGYKPSSIRANITLILAAITACTGLALLYLKSIGR